MHRHVYRLVGQFSSEGKGVAYEDWACIKPGCTRVERTYFSSPPRHRVMEGTPTSGEGVGQKVFGASDA